jgi:hypothetical protein
MIPALDDCNGWADFVRYQLGVNVIPAVYKDKVPIVKWANWQTQPIPLELHNEWKAKNMFRDGMAIVLGNVFHNDKAGSYLACLDTDNGLATKSIALSPKETLVQQRKNGLDRAHSYFYSPRPVKRKPSGANNRYLKDRYDNNLAPKFELRCVGDVVYTGKHESGFYYEIIGQEKPASLSLDQVQGIENRVNDICNKFGLINSIDQPASDLFKEEYEVYEGQNRSRELKRAMCSLLQRNWGILEFNVIKGLASDWHDKHCKPPYQKGIFERNWKQSLEFIGRSKEATEVTVATTEKEEPVVNNEWSENVAKQYTKLYDVVKENLPNLWTALEFGLSVKTILNIEGCSLPFAGIILGPPSSLKTVAIELLRSREHTYFTNNFNARAFVTHNSAIKKKDLGDYDMLPKLKNKLFLTPELAPTFTARDEELLQTLGILTAILDGHGYESDTGAQGHRGYSEDIMFTWLGAAVDIPYKVYKHLSYLGPKLHFFRLPKIENTEDYHFAHKDDDFNLKLDKIRLGLDSYFDCFSSAELMKIKLNREKDEPLAHRYIIRLAELLAHLRAVVPTWETKGSGGSDYAYGTAIIEDESRAITQLRNLARGHALSQGRFYITTDDIFIIAQTVLSTCSIERAKVFNLLIGDDEGRLTTAEVMKGLHMVRATALRAMTELDATQLVDKAVEYEDQEYNPPKHITLKPKFKWFLTSEFKRCLKNCTPRRYIDILNNQISYGVQDRPRRGGHSSKHQIPSLNEVDTTSKISKPVFPTEIHKCYYCTWKETCTHVEFVAHLEKCAEIERDRLA